MSKPALSPPFGLIRLGLFGVLVTATIIETDTGDAHGPQVAVDPNGNATAVWDQSDGTGFVLNVWSNRYTPGAGWGTAVTIDGTAAGSSPNPQVAVDLRGDAIAVWQQNDGSGWDVWSNRYTPGAGWGTAVLIQADADGPEVAVDPSGNATAVWRKDDSAVTFSIGSNRYTPGAGWDTGLLIETDTGRALHPQVAVDPNGNATAVWDQSDGTWKNIRSNRYTPGAGWGTAVTIETGAGNSTHSQVTVDPNGNATAVWERSDGAGNTHIWSNRFE